MGSLLESIWLRRTVVSFTAGFSRLVRPLSVRPTWLSSRPVVPVPVRDAFVTLGSRAQ
jgi:hypothetical protein